jgi:hypothetical protein
MLERRNQPYMRERFEELRADLLLRLEHAYAGHDPPHLGALADQMTRLRIRQELRDAE